MFFDKILDALNMENWKQRENEQPSLCHYDTSYRSDIISPYDDEYRFLLNIKQYWKSHKISYRSPAYKEANYSERSEYALVTVLGFFEKANDPKNFSELILYYLGITNWYKYVEKLLHDNYIKFANDFELLCTYNLNTLKSIATEYQIKKSGRKIELVHRIYSSLSEDQIAPLVNCLGTRYILTDKARSYLQLQSDLVQYYTFRNCGVSLSEFYAQRVPDGIHRRKFHDTMFQALCEKIFFCQCNQLYETETTLHFDIYQILIDELKKTNSTRPEVALFNYLEYLYLMSCFISSASTHAQLEYPSHYQHAGLPRPHKNLHILYDYKKYIDYDALIMNKPPSFFTQDEFIQYVNEMFEDRMFDVEKWDSILLHRLNRYFTI